jgi:hypothetical protein
MQRFLFSAYSATLDRVPNAVRVTAERGEVTQAAGLSERYTIQTREGLQPSKLVAGVTLAVLDQLGLARGSCPPLQLL